MIKWIVNFFGIKKEKINFKQLINDGAIIIDVRSAQEFQGGHVKQSKNIPLNELNIKYKSLKKNKTIITCCALGMRSGSAVNFLKSQGFEKVYNGGGWMHLNGKVKG
jgi:phage shock protein E|tara:strand:- start:49 stop:369 length:321 start_codon:yes stop_codon:yes gene_type:complete